MKFEIHQRNTYRYDHPVRQSINQFRLRPADNGQQSLLSYEVTLDPAGPSYGYIDYWGNYVETFYLWDAHHSLTIDTFSVVKTCPVQIQEKDSLTPKQIEELHSLSFRQKYAEYLVSTNYTDVPDYLVREHTGHIWKSAVDSLDYVKKLNSYLYQRLTYRAGATTVKTKAVEVLKKREGVCQDYTHLMLALCRYWGIPARYVSGYIYIGENSALRGDAATHAWVEVKFPGLSWIGVDPTNNVFAGEQHIKLATGRDYNDITPLKGVYIGSEHTLGVCVRVKRVDNN